MICLFLALLSVDLVTFGADESRGCRLLRAVAGNGGNREVVDRGFSPASPGPERFPGCRNDKNLIHQKNVRFHAITKRNGFSFVFRCVKKSLSLVAVEIFD